MRKIVLAAFLIFTTTSSFAQNINQNSGWFLFLNSTKFSDKWGMHFDLQIRSDNDWNRVRNVLVRPGITYYINKNSNATLGYLYTPTFLGTKINYIDADGNSVSKSSLTEHRIWQQYILAHQLGSGALSHRFRLEQRFIGQPIGDDIFSQRFRYFFRLVQPLKKQDGGFSKGIFAALQNELFFNIQNKDELNGSVFDQNRAYIAAGYRFSKKFDIEAGYLNQAINGKTNHTVNHVVQLALYTRF